MALSDCRLHQTASPNLTDLGMVARVTKTTAAGRAIRHYGVWSASQGTTMRYLWSRVR